MAAVTEEQAVNIMRKPQAGKICQIHPALHQHCYVPSRLLNTEMFKWCLGGAGLCLGFPAGSRVEQRVCHVVCAIILLMGFEDLERISLIWGGMHSALFKEVSHQSPDNQSAVTKQHRAVVFEVRDFVNRDRCCRPKALHGEIVARSQYFLCVGNIKMGFTCPHACVCVCVSLLHTAAPGLLFCR